MLDLLSRIRGHLDRRRLWRDSDLGRRFGWEILEDGNVVGELEYIGWESSSQFRHSYRKRPPDLCLSGGDDTPFWRRELELRSKAVPEYRCNGFMAVETGDGIVSVRALYVPWQNFRAIEIRRLETGRFCPASIEIDRSNEGTT